MRNMFVGPKKVYEPTLKTSISVIDMGVDTTSSAGTHIS